MEISTWIRGARLKTLPLAIAPVVIGAALSWRGVFLYSQGGDIWHEPCPFFGGQHDLSELKFGSLVGECQRSAGWFILVAVLCGCVALFLQVAANFANDYSDGIRGTDEGVPSIPHGHLQKHHPRNRLRLGNASGIAAPAWPRPSRRVRRESKESTCRGSPRI